MAVERFFAEVEALLGSDASPWTEECEQELARAEELAGRPIPPLLGRLFRSGGERSVIRALASSPKFEIHIKGVSPAAILDVRSATGWFDYDTDGEVERLRSVLSPLLFPFGADIGGYRRWLLVGESDDPPVMFVGAGWYPFPEGPDSYFNEPYSLAALSFEKFLAGLIMPEVMWPWLTSEHRPVDLDDWFTGVSVVDEQCVDSPELVHVFDELLDSMMTVHLAPRSQPNASVPFAIRDRLVGPKLPPPWGPGAQHRLDPRGYGLRVDSLQNRMHPVINGCLMTALALVQETPIDDRLNVFGLGKDAQVTGEEAAAVLASWKVEGDLDDLGLWVRDNVCARVFSELAGWPWSAT